MQCNLFRFNSHFRKDVRTTQKAGNTWLQSGSVSCAPRSRPRWGSAGSECTPQRAVWEAYTVMSVII